MSKQTRIDRFNFRGALAPPVVASRQGIWCKADTSAAGAPTVQSGSGGAMELTLAADNEAENICFYMGDVLPYDIEDLVRVEFIAKLTASLPAAVSAALGVISARNDAIDTIAEAALFRCIGDNNLVVETDDGTNNNDDIATGETLAATYKRLVIDFASGLKAQSPPSKSKGGLADVRFHVGNANGSLRRVAPGTAFDMSNYTGNLQLFAQLQKTAAVSVATLSLLEVEVEYRLPI